VVVTLGLTALVYGFTKAASDGWDSLVTWSFIGAGLAFIAVFVVIESRSRNPLLPLRIVADRNRGGAYLASMLVGAGLFGAFLFLTLYLQFVLGYTPLEAGFASLPVTVGVLVSATVASNLLPRVGPKPLMIIGPVLAAVGMFSLSFVDLDTSFWSHLMPAQVLLGLGLGFTFVPLSSLALIGVPQHDSGAASAALNATQQVGGSLGTALLNTIAATATANYLISHGGAAATGAGLVHGYTVAFTWSLGALVLAVVLSLVLLTKQRPEPFEQTSDEVDESVFERAEGLGSIV